MTALFPLTRARSPGCQSAAESRNIGRRKLHTGEPASEGRAHRCGSHRRHDPRFSEHRKKLSQLNLAYGAVSGVRGKYWLPAKLVHSPDAFRPSATMLQQIDSDHLEAFCASCTSLLAALRSAGSRPALRIAALFLAYSSPVQGNLDTSPEREASPSPRIKCRTKALTQDDDRVSPCSSNFLYTVPGLHLRISTSTKASTLYTGLKISIFPLSFPRAVPLRQETLWNLMEGDFP